MALEGPRTPPEVQIEIEDVHADIARIKPSKYTTQEIVSLLNQARLIAATDAGDWGKVISTLRGMPSAHIDEALRRLLTKAEAEVWIKQTKTSAQHAELLQDWEKATRLLEQLAQHLPHDRDIATRLDRARLKQIPTFTDSAQKYSDMTDRPRQYKNAEPSWQERFFRQIQDGGWRVLLFGAIVLLVLIFLLRACSGTS